MKVTLLARKKMRGRVTKSFLRLLLPVVIACFGAVMVAPAVLCLVYGTDTVLANAGLAWMAGPWTAVLLPAALLACGTVLFLFAAAFSFYAKAWVFYAMDRNQTRPGSLLRPSQALRFLRCRAGTLCRKTGWLILYLLPAGGLYAALRLFADSPVLTGAVGAVLVGADALLALTGAVFFAAESSRYYMTDYLLYLNPLMPPREAVASSVKLTGGKLAAIAFRRLSLLPWALAELLVLPLPFAAVYRRFCAAALCEILFGEDKRRAKAPTVVFYVDRRSRFREAET